MPVFDLVIAPIEATSEVSESELYQSQENHRSWRASTPWKGGRPMRQRSLQLLGTFMAIGILIGDGAAIAEPVKIAISQSSEVIMPLNGKYRLQCQSRWHKVDLHCKVGGKLTLSADTISQFAPNKPIPINQSWTLPASVASRIATRLHETKTLTPMDTAQWARWTGSKPSQVKEQFGGTLSGTLKEVKRIGDVDVAVIAVSGELTVSSTGRLSSRYGPNTWDIQWRYAVNGKAHINLKTRQVVKFNFGTRASEKGKFYTPNATSDEPFTAAMTLNSDQLEPPDAATTRRVAALVAELGNEEFVTREEATLDLHKLGLSIAPLLKQHLAKATDPEVKSRLERLLKSFGG